MARRFLFGAHLDLARHRLAHFLADVADQADRARHHADAADDLPRQLELARDSGDRAGGVDGKSVLP